MKKMTPDLARKIMPLAKQYEIQEGWLKKRLATLLPKFMKETGFDMWIVMTDEQNEDPITKTLLPASMINARGKMILMYILRDDGSVLLESVSRPSGVEHIYRNSWYNITDTDWKGKKMTPPTMTQLEYVRHLHGKMLRTPAQPAAGLQRADTAPVWKPDPPPEDRPLERDLQLGFNSISTPNGHYGSQITYIHLQRVVEEKIWGDKTEIKTISVPEEVQTVSGLAQYLRQKAPALMTHIRACGGEWFTRY